MKKIRRILFFAFLLLAAFINVGCDKNGFYPASDIQITKAEPFNILPSNADFDSIEDGVITAKLLNSIPCELVSYDLTYRTVLNEPIDSLTITDIPINIPFAEAGTETSITLKPYQKQVLDLFNNTTSNISPIRATVTLHFRDVNKNEVIRNASFLLYKYIDTSTSE
ncbi:MAG: hypothetical protein IKO19_05035 [Candidatus Riflebacteria bacterium]|nr:hypothetical protein [Candidatus Riflebacteria bacterium]